jgi:hypothetical protein
MNKNGFAHKNNQKDNLEVAEEFSLKDEPSISSMQGVKKLVKKGEDMMKKYSNHHAN